MRDPLAEMFTASVVRKLAGPRAYRRGKVYYDLGLIGISVGADRRLAVTVQGTVPYLVKLWDDRGEPGWSCTCPAAEDGSFCKHCAAVALSLDPSDPPAELLESAPDQLSSGALDQELSDFVEQLPHSRLADIVLSQAASDRPLRDRLMAEARTGGAESPELTAWRRRIEAAFRPWGDFVTYCDAPRWAAGVNDAIDDIEDLCDTGHPAEAALLAEHAMRLTDAAIECVDDSDGWLTDFSYRLIEVHHRACVEDRPNPVELAGRLLQMELTTDLNGPYRSAASYAGVLGEEGLAAYRGLIEPRWRKARLKGDDYFSGDNFRVHQAMVGWALATGDPDTLIEVHSRTRMLPDQYLEISRALHSAGRVEEAIEWLRRGFREWADRPWQLADLREFLAAVLRERGDPNAAVGLFWDAFCSEPSLSSYRRLLREAGGEADTDGEWSRRCVEEMRARLSKEVSTEAARRGAATAPADVLAEILFFEGRTEEAWSSAADFGCRDEMWMTMARAREQSHPLQAIDVYEPEVFRRIDQRNNHAYRSAVDLMNHIHLLAEAAGNPDRFTELLGRVRAEHKAKRNLKKLLDDRGW